MRDHTRLRAFQLADVLVLAVYRITRGFPREEQFGLTSQMRRAAISVASNIVEGCARRTEADYLHFLDMAFGSLRELSYQLSLSFRLGHIRQDDYQSVRQQAEECSKVLAALIRSLRRAQQPNSLKA